MAQASAAVRAQVASLAEEVLEGRLGWDDFLQALPEEVGDDESIHELIDLLQIGPPPGIVSEDVYQEYKAGVREKMAQVRGDPAPTASP